jgi:hypothetical protein
VSEDLVDAPGLDDGSSSPDLSMIMRFAELYPAIPLQSVVGEVRHADRSVPVGADDRSEVIARVVEARLAGYSVQFRDNGMG